jgi:hypothetical protein
MTCVKASAEFPALKEMMTAKPWVWKSIVAGAVGSVVHLVFMYLKSRTGLLPSFQPYQSLQAALAARVGTNVPAIVPWALSFLNGMTVLGFLFARIKRLLPGKSGAAKGVTFGLVGWVFMGLIFFPAIGLGPFAVDVGSGFGPALLSLVMLQAYSIVLGTVYGLLEGANDNPGYRSG